MERSTQDFDEQLFDVLGTLTIDGHDEPDFAQSLQDFTVFTSMSMGVFLMLSAVHMVMQHTLDALSFGVITLLSVLIGVLMALSVVASHVSTLCASWFRRYGLRGRVELQLLKILTHTEHEGLKERLGLLLPQLHNRRIGERFFKRVQRTFRHLPEAYHEFAYDRLVDRPPHAPVWFFQSCDTAEVEMVGLHTEEIASHPPSSADRATHG